MKKKSKKAALKKKKEFRFHKVRVINKKGQETGIWHPAYIFLEKGNVYIYVTITHSDSVNEFLVVELKKNPNPNDNRKAYWVADIRECTKDSFRRKENGWEISDEDDIKIRKLYDTIKK